MTPDDPTPPRSSRPSGRPAPQPTGRPRGTTPGSSRGGYDPRFAGPILGGEVAIPSKREIRKARQPAAQPRASGCCGRWSSSWPSSCVVVGLGYGYFRYQWGQIASAPCATCVAAANGAPYNLLLIGSDSRAGETAAQAQQFGTAQAAGGPAVGHHQDRPRRPAGRHRLDPVDPPRHLRHHHRAAGQLASSSTQNKINAAFAGGPDALVKTIENTFGIPISHYIVINFFGVMDAVNALGGISLDFPYPARDRDCSTGTCYNNSGLDIPTAGCQVLNGSQALSLSRSRYYQYYANGVLALRPDVGPRPHPAPEPGDLGRPQQGQVDLQPAAAQLAPVLGGPRLHQGRQPDGRRTCSPWPSATTPSAARRCSPTCCPTTGAVSSYAGDVEVVQPDAAAATITQFLGGPFGTIITPPIDALRQPADPDARRPTTTTAPVATTHRAVGLHLAGARRRRPHRHLGPVLRPDALLIPPPEPGRPAGAPAGRRGSDSGGAHRAGDPDGPEDRPPPWRPASQRLDDDQRARSPATGGCPVGSRPGTRRAPRAMATHHTPIGHRDRGDDDGHGHGQARPRSAAPARPEVEAPGQADAGRTSRGRGVPATSGAQAEEGDAVGARRHRCAGGRSR